MKIKLFDISKYNHQIAYMAVKMVDSLVWGNQMNRNIKELKIYKNSDGDLNDPKLFKGLIDIYNPKTKICKLQIKGLIEMGKDDPSNLAWSICHDLSHAFDIVYGNLKFNRKDKTISYLNKIYTLNQEANGSVPVEYLKLLNFRRDLYYQALDYYEPWEVRALIAADACMAEYRRGNLCPNLVRD